MFKSENLQENAVHIVQYIVNGLTSNEEHHLVLNKLLCGLEINAVVSEGITLSTNDKKIITGMLTAMIEHWPAVGGKFYRGVQGKLACERRCALRRT